MSDDDTPRFPADDLKVDFGEKVIRDPDFMARVRAEEKRADERREQQMRELAEQARRDAIAGFDKVHLAGFDLFLCPGCSALVVNRERHLDWHGVMAQAATDASEAAWRGRPIG